MPGGPQNVEDFSKKLQELRKSGASNLRERFKGGFTKGRIAILIVILALIVIFLIIVPFAKFYTDALWYNHVGFQNLFYKTLVAKILSVLLFRLFFYALLYRNSPLARGPSPKQEFKLERSPRQAVDEKDRGASK